MQDGEQSGAAPHHGMSLGAIVRRYPVTTLLIVGSVVVALASNLGSRDKIMSVLTWLTLADLQVFDGSINSGWTAILQGEIWRLITPIFIHFGLLHIVFNLMWLRDLGPLIEQRWSSKTLLWLVVVAAVCSNVAQFLVDWDLRSGVRYANALSGGMSGVVYALLGYIWMRSRFDPRAGIRINPTIVVLMIVWLVVCMSGVIGSVANMAHLVGLLVGVIWGRIVAAKSARDYVEYEHFI